MLRLFEKRKVGDDHHVVVFDILPLEGLLVAGDTDVQAGLVLNFSGAGSTDRETTFTLTNRSTRSKG